RPVRPARRGWLKRGAIFCCVTALHRSRLTGDGNSAGEPCRALVVPHRHCVRCGYACPAGREERTGGALGAVGAAGGLAASSKARAGQRGPLVSSGSVPATGPRTSQPPTSDFLLSTRGGRRSPFGNLLVGPCRGL